MRPWIGILLVAIGGAVGATARHLSNEIFRHWLEPKLGRAWPISTLLVNVVGCLMIGLLMAMFRRERLSEEWRLLLVTGGLGGLTTFSAFSYDTLTLTRDASFGAGLLNMALNVGLCLLAVWIGWWLGGGYFETKSSL